ncbi:MAG: spore cortex biosynthesis protein YabQ [Oscillospiraceae bacterium]|nr:spore cortex biosynthesis protein YabQ [Oscillospiraceae bacterium]
MIDFNPGSFTGVIGEFRMLGLAAVVGAVLGAAFDILRILRITIPHNEIAVFIEDFFFTLFFGLVFFSFSVEMLEGQLRLYVLAGMALGFGIYLSTLGRIISWIFRAAVNFLRKAAGSVRKRLKNTLPAKKFPEK